MDRILVASDLSHRSDRAVGRGVALARAHRAGLTLCHVVDEAMPAEIAKKVEAEARESLDRFARSRAGADEVQIEVKTAIGDPVTDVCRIASEVGAELFVVGSHRARMFFDGFRETTVERLIRLSEAPCLLVAEAADHDYERVLTAVDMSPACARAVAVAKAVAPDAALTLFHAYHVPFKGLTGEGDAASGAVRRIVEETERAVDAWIAASELPADLPRPKLIDSAPRGALDAMIASTGPHLLAIGAHTQSSVGRWALGGFAADLIRDPPCDLLIAR
ncbi:MAG: universal stress protein [Pseudomonadota bacterium]